ncbi:hypothetical protein BDZ91DRAFT_718820 [Kalaharituber pfeilii]|nr:hypothetical protein BDZ91DRAFT_718820 [Kalaharituber pfeilii]
MPTTSSAISDAPSSLNSPHVTPYIYVPSSSSCSPSTPALACHVTGGHGPCVTPAASSLFSPRLSLLENKGPIEPPLWQLQSRKNASVTNMRHRKLPNKPQHDDVYLVQLEAELRAADVECPKRRHQGCRVCARMESLGSIAAITHVTYECQGTSNIREDSTEDDNVPWEVHAEVDFLLFPTYGGKCPVRPLGATEVAQDIQIAEWPELEAHLLELGEPPEGMFPPLF